MHAPREETPRPRRRSLLRRVAARAARALRGDAGREDPKIVSVTPMRVDADSRTYKQAASLERFGYRAVLIEGQSSDLEGTEFPFRLDTLGERLLPPLPAGLAKAAAAAKAPYELSRFLWRFYSAWLVERCLIPLRELPPAPLYYMHAPEYFPAVWLKCLLHGGQYIYDAHDFYSHMDSRETHTASERVFVLPWYRLVERLTVKHAAEVVTVSQGLVDLHEQAFGRRPVLMRNVQDPRLESEPGDDLRTRLGLDDDAFLMVMVGKAKRGQAVAEMFQAMTRLPPRTHFALLGGDHDQHREQIASLGLVDRVHVVPPVKPFEVVPFIRSADAGVVLYYPRSPNYQHILPNGFFQLISAGLPVLYPDLPDIGRVANPRGFGLQIDPRDPASIERAVETLLSDPARLDELRASARHAGTELCWEREERILAALVEDVLAEDLQA